MSRLGSIVLVSIMLPLMLLDSNRAGILVGAFVAHKKATWFICPFDSSSLLLSSSKNGTEQKPSCSSLPPPYPAPRARREENRVVLAGVAPPGWNMDIPRQAIDSTEPLLDPPVAIPDPYGWMRDDTRQSQEILDYIQQENNYTEACTRHFQQPLQDQLMQELCHHNNIQKEDISLPRFMGGWSYYTRTVPNQPYKLHCRVPEESSLLQNNTISPPTCSNGTTSPPTDRMLPILNDEEILLDENEVARQTHPESSNSSSYFSIHSILPSPSHTMVAYSFDRRGDERYELRLFDIQTSQTYTILTNPSMCGSIVWANDSNTIYYLQPDTTGRPYQLISCSHLLAGVGRREDGTTTNHRTNNIHATSIYTNTPMTTSKRNGCWGIFQYTLVWQESNLEYWCSLTTTLDQHYLLVTSASGSGSSSASTEIWASNLMPDDTHEAGNGRVDNRKPCDDRLLCIAPRRHEVSYSVEHGHGYWWILSNRNIIVGREKHNTEKDPMRLWRVPVNGPADCNWTLICTGESLWANVDEHFNSPLDEIPSMESVHVFVHHIVIQGRYKGLPRIWILSLNNDDNCSSGREADQLPPTIQSIHLLEFDDEVHYVCLSKDQNYDFNTTSIVCSYQSLITPPQDIRIELNDPWQRTVLRQQQVPGYDATRYICHRMTVPSRDGITKLPLSIIYRKDTFNRSPAPFHLFGYGSYGHSLEAAFSPSRLPLLNRGMIWGLAHVRGGGEFGREVWYETAKGLSKHHSFEDFVDIGRWLVQEGWTTPDMLSCEGRSAGGLLIGASMNLAPNLFRVALLGVPFLDVLCTMVDASLPMTAVEWHEWGNPNEKPYFDCIRKYDPIHNVKSNVVYPSCLLMASLYDFRAPYWDALKFAATVRHSSRMVQQDPSRPICVKIDTHAGHSWGSDRYKHYQELAFFYAFLLDQLGLGTNEITNEP